MLDSDLQGAIAEVLRDKAGDSSPVQRVSHVGGGDINAAARLTTAKGDYFIKWNPRPLPGMFLAEARGLRELETAGELRVPQLFGTREVKGSRPAFIVMEWLGGGGSKHGRTLGETLGRGLAALHQHTQPAYGWQHENYIGSLAQANGETADWVAFYRDRRIGFQMELAAKKGHMPTRRGRQLERLMARLDEWIDPTQVRPALLHGDLWGGNYMAGPNGEPVLIDPAVYYGDREVELAFTELFGGFSSTFYAAYNEIWPLSAGYRARKKLYQLYPLMVHLNLFGEGYGNSVDSVLADYVGG